MCLCVRNIASELAANCALVASVTALLVAGGCQRGVERVAVSGKVLIDGEPLTLGTIRFVPKTGRPAGSRIGPDGSFRVISKSQASGGSEVPGLFPGRYQIAVSASEALSEAEDAELHWLAPRQYANFRTSGLETDIQAPTDSLIIELTWEGFEETDAESDTEEPPSLDEVDDTVEQEKANP